MMRHTGFLLLTALAALLSCEAKAPSLAGVRPAEAAPPTMDAPVAPSHQVLRLTQPRMSGDEVLLLQRRLLELGYKELGDADGWFGPRTESAVQRFQGYLGFGQTGIVDDALWAALLYPSPIVANACADLADVLSYDLSGPFEYGDLGESPAGVRYTADWYSAGVGVQAVVFVENPPQVYGDEVSDDPSAWLVFPFEGRWIISRVNAYVPQQTPDLENLHPLYIVGPAVYRFVDGEGIVLNGTEELVAMVETIENTVLANPEK